MPLELLLFCIISFSISAIGIYIYKRKKHYTHYFDVNKPSLTDLPEDLLILLYNTIPEALSFCYLSRTCRTLRDISKYTDIQRKAKNRMTKRKVIPTQLDNTFLEYYALPNGTKHGHFTAYISELLSNRQEFIRYLDITSVTGSISPYFIIDTNCYLGQTDGEFKVLDAIGEIVFCGRYVRGKKVGIFNSWTVLNPKQQELYQNNNDGQVISKQAVMECQYNEDGLLHGDFKSWFSGELFHYATYHRGKIDKVHLYKNRSWPFAGLEIEDQLPHIQHLVIDKCAQHLTNINFNGVTFDTQFNEALGAYHSDHDATYAPKIINSLSCIRYL